MTGITVELSLHKVYFWLALNLVIYLGLMGLFRGPCYVHQL